MTTGLVWIHTFHIMFKNQVFTVYAQVFAVVTLIDGTTSSTWWNRTLPQQTCLQQLQAPLSQRLRQQLKSRPQLQLVQLQLVQPRLLLRPLQLQLQQCRLRLQLRNQPQQLFSWSQPPCCKQQQRNCQRPQQRRQLFPLQLLLKPMFL